MKVATTTGDFLWYTKPGDISSALTLLADSGFRCADINLSDLLYEGSPCAETTGKPGRTTSATRQPDWG